MKRDEEETLGRLVQVASLVLPTRFSKEHCLNGTRVLTDVLEHFGIEATPLSVNVVVANKKWREKMAELYESSDGNPYVTQALSDKWVKEGAWSLGSAAKMKKVENGFWSGHLVLVTDSVLIDSSAEQFSRHKRKIKLPEVLLHPHTKDFLEEGDALSIIGPRGVWVRYWTRHEDVSYRNLPGFQKTEQNLEAVKKIIKLMGIKPAETSRSRPSSALRSLQPPKLRTLRPRSKKS